MMRAKQDNNIYVKVSNEKILLQFPKCNIETEAFIGENGVTTDKVEGDGKTLLGEFELGNIYGMNSKKEIKEKIHKEYTQINNNMYWVDDSNSKYYNQIVDITKENKDWNSAEHLIEYPTQYEYFVEIKINPENIPGKGSAVFLHCSKGNKTKGCIAVKKDIMEKIIKNIDEYTKIIIAKI